MNNACAVVRDILTVLMVVHCDGLCFCLWSGGTVP